jgi:hypothetical protein
MLRSTVPTGHRSLPREFLEWQVRLRAWTARERNGSPHVGVAPLLAVHQPGVGPGVSMHAIICGLLPSPALLADKTAAFRALYEAAAADGARAIYDRGLDYLKEYYRAPEDFDATSISTLLPEDAAAVRALRADPTCALLFYVFELDDSAVERRFRCWQVNCRAELHSDGPIYDNVWWHNALFHGKLDGHVVVRFVHRDTYDTRFGTLERADG